MVRFSEGSAKGRWGLSHCAAARLAREKAIELPTMMTVPIAAREEMGVEKMMAAATMVTARRSELRTEWVTALSIISTMSDSSARWGRGGDADGEADGKVEERDAWMGAWGTGGVGIMCGWGGRL